MCYNILQEFNKNKYTTMYTTDFSSVILEKQNVVLTLVYLYSILRRLEK